jgi:hypothetical protein
MTAEQSYGKARTIMTRSSDLRPLLETVEKRSDGRDANGRFAPGTRAALGARFKATIRKSLGKRGEGDAEVVYRDAQRVFAHTMRSMPSDEAPVRTLVVLHARHVALHGYFTAKAEVAGLDTEEGARLLEIADRQSQRAERVLVTALDAARVCAARRKDGPIDLDAELAAEGARHTP